MAIKKIGINVRSLINGITCGAITLLFFQTTHCSAQATKDISKEIDVIRSDVISIELYTLTTDLSLRRSLNEDDVVRMGCKYSLTSTDDIATLLDVFVNARLIEPQASISMVEPRIVVYFRTRAGASVDLVLSREYSNGPARGTYNHHTIAVAKTGFSDELRRWRMEHKPLIARISSCSDA